jgi:peptidoglycan/xylan/chitin deacetylase (PgdA/CDA1 family)
MARLLRNLLDVTFARSPFQPAFQRVAGRRLAVLTYHSVPDGAAFGRHLSYLRREAHPVSLHQLLETIEREAPLPERSVLITFDDADRTLLEVAVPLLQRYEMPAMACVVAGALDSNEPFWWDEVEELVMSGGGSMGFPRDHSLVQAMKQVHDRRRLQVIDDLRASAERPATRVQHLRADELPLLEAGGVAIANHSLTHPCLPRCTNDKIETEVFAAHQILTRALGHPPSAFVYPNGDCNDHVRGVVGGAGYRIAFLFDHRMVSFPVSDPLRVSRLRVDPSVSLDRLRIVLSGLHPAVHRIRMALRRTANPPSVTAQ